MLPCPCCTPRLQVVVRELEGSTLLHWQQLQLEEAQRSVHRLVRGLDCFSGARAGGRRAVGTSGLQQAQGTARLLGLPGLGRRGTRPRLQPPDPLPSRPAAPCAAEGILLLDAEEGWEIRYANSAVAKLTGLDQQRAVGAAFWSLFGRGPGAAPRGEVDAAVAARQPFALPCALLADSAWSRASASSLAVHGSGGVEVQAYGAQALFSVTFTPATAPDFRPDEPAIAIPAYAGSGRGSNGGGGADASARLWFATLQAPAAEASTGAASTLASSCTPSSPRCALERLRPDNMREVQLGPLLGAGACGKAYRGTWMGSDVCVKVRAGGAGVRVAAGARGVCAGGPALACCRHSPTAPPVPPFSYLPFSLPGADPGDPGPAAPARRARARGRRRCRRAGGHRGGSPLPSAAPPLHCAPAWGLHAPGATGRHRQ